MKIFEVQAYARDPYMASEGQTQENPIIILADEYRIIETQTVAGGLYQRVEFLRGGEVVEMFSKIPYRITLKGETNAESE